MSGGGSRQSTAAALDDVFLVPLLTLRFSSLAARASDHGVSLCDK